MEAGYESEHGREEVRLEKVARLRAAIVSGRYRVSAADLAERLMEFMQRQESRQPRARVDEEPREV